MKSFRFCFFFIALTFLSVNAQVKDYELGVDVMGMRYQPQGGNYNYADPAVVNIKVAVWGWVRYPGKYTVPNYTSVSDLLSYAGGPTDAADLEDLRIYRVNEDSTQTLVKFNYNDILYESKLEYRYRKVPKLEAGDILVIPGEPRMYFRDNFSIWMSILSALISLTILVLNVVRK